MINKTNTYRKISGSDEWSPEGASRRDAGRMGEWMPGVSQIDIIRLYLQVKISLYIFLFTLGSLTTDIKVADPAR